MFLFPVYKTEETTLSDNELVSWIASRKKKAMKALVERYKKRAYYLALGMVGNTDEAYDISQEAFIRVFKSAHTFDPNQQFFPWFYSILRNLCLNCLQRRQNRESRDVALDDCEYLLEADSNPETAVIQKEQVQRIRKALMRLDPDDREIIAMKHFRDCSYDEIAGLLKIQKGTVMSRLYYARKKLAKLLIDDE
ncbi:MAG: RNA polymerase sigma factor [candidate division Zixibacteria bacterium]|nr:RNA polymerase sigma factor [candidate division Zixibacteria bacterium]